MKERSATGPFSVKATPQAPHSPDEGTWLGRVSFHKQFSGDLEATSVVEMLSVGTPVGGSAAYVAMEKINGSLHGQSGTFALQHACSLNRGVPVQSIQVVPDSGTGALTGLSGSLTIDIREGGAHFYVFRYSLPE